MKRVQILKTIFKTNLIKSMYFSLKYKGVILVGYGCKLNIKKNAVIRVKKGGKLFLGVGITLPAKTVLDIYREGCLEIGGNVSIHKGCKIMIGENALLKIGAKTYINEHSRIQCRKSIEIGERCAISWNVDIIDSDEHLIIENNIPKANSSPVVIGNKVWIGLKATVLKGSIINDNSIIGANSLVNGICKGDSIYAGVPAKLIKENISWK